ncbi:hypothetical protein MPSEU_000094100 [Mayamaea pseudoterrestris]|nr:hypothetical protein MPSEU_000094100 [Mayamaea pseudoterrestris]
MKLNESSIFTFMWLLVGCSQARKNHDVPHPHRGVLKQYEPGPFGNIKLTKKDEDNLASGNPIMIQSDAGKDDVGGGAICVQDVLAPKSAVWNQILDLNSYKSKVPKLNECKNYYQAKTDDGSVCIKTKMVLGVMPGYSYTNYYDHRYYPKQDSLTWTLDYDKTSDFDDVVGHWHLEDHPSKTDVTRVFYACDIKLTGKVPGPIFNYISKAALKQATSWVKRESESNPEAAALAPFGVAPGNSVKVSKKRKWGFGQ